MISRNNNCIDVRSSQTCRSYNCFVPIESCDYRNNELGVICADSDSEHPCLKHFYCYMSGIVQHGYEIAVVLLLDLQLSPSQLTAKCVLYVLLP